MSLSQHAEQVAITVSTRTTYTGAGVAAATKAAEKTGITGILSTNGPEVVNLCAIGGLAVGVIGLAFQVFFLIRKDRRERRESRWRMGDPDRRSNPR